MSEYGSYRQRKLTEKGKQYQLGLLQDLRRKQELAIRKSIEQMEELFTEDKRELLMNKYEELNNQFEDFMQIHGRCQILIEEEDRERDDSAVDDFDRKIYAFRKRVRSWLSQSEKAKSEEPKKTTSSASSRKSHSSGKSRSASRKSEKSRSSSEKSMKFRVKEEEARLAELELEAAYFKKQQETELAAKELKIQLEIAKVNAKLKIFKEEDEDQDDIESKYREDESLSPSKLEVADKQKLVKEYVDVVDMYNKRTSYLPRNEYADKLKDDKDEETPSAKTYTAASPDRKQPEIYNLNRKEKSEETYSAASTQPEESKVDGQGKLADMLNHLQAPQVDIDTFDGNPLDYLYFMATFVEAVEKKVKEPRGCLTRLLKYLVGEPKELISSCIYLPSSTCYQEAKNLLYKQYGDPYRILSNY